MNRFAKWMSDYALARFFLPAGLFLLIFGIVLNGIVNDRKSYPQTDAVVTRLELYEPEHTEDDTHYDATYQIFVRYTVDGKEYETELGILTEMEVGSAVRIDYNPDDPTDIGQPTGVALPIGVMAAGAVFLAVGVVSAVRTAKKNRQLKQQESEWNHGS